ncbi:secreted protein [gut metagenome]|uniref:Secreted protein n=1 Tax=gut metagenome TaxID=749906 RepID=J9BW82_9ZZZZ
MPATSPSRRQSSTVCLLYLLFRWLSIAIWVTVARAQPPYLPYSHSWLWVSHRFWVTM